MPDALQRRDVLLLQDQYIAEIGICERWVQGQNLLELRLCFLHSTGRQQEDSEIPTRHGPERVLRHPLSLQPDRFVVLSLPRQRPGGEAQHEGVVGIERAARRELRIGRRAVACLPVVLRQPEMRLRLPRTEADRRLRGFALFLKPDIRLDLALVGQQAVYPCERSPRARESPGRLPTPFRSGAGPARCRPGPVDNKRTVPAGIPRTRAHRAEAAPGP